eukprot:1161286-Pelagomonas_calceolata.AAC.8
MALPVSFGCGECAYKPNSAHSWHFQCHLDAVSMLTKPHSTHSWRCRYARAGKRDACLLAAVDEIICACPLHCVGLTDWDVSSMMGKLAIFAFAAWASLQSGGVIAGLAMAGVVLAATSTSATLMQLWYRCGGVVVVCTDVLLWYGCGGVVVVFTDSECRSEGGAYHKYVPASGGGGVHQWSEKKSCRPSPVLNLRFRHFGQSMRCLRHVWSTPQLSIFDFGGAKQNQEGSHVNGARGLGQETVVFSCPWDKSI